MTSREELEKKILALQQTLKENTIPPIEKKSGESKFDFSMRTDKINIEEYENVIEYLADSKEDLVFPNSGKEHAKIVMANIFRTANNYVNIFAGDLNGDVSNGIYLIRLEEYLSKKDTRLNVVLEKIPTQKSEAISLILKYKKQKQAGYITTSFIKDYTPSLFFDNYKIKHFTIADDRMYRLEEDTDQYIADLNFNDETRTAELRTKFSEINAIEFDEDIFETT